MPLHEPSRQAAPLAGASQNPASHQTTAGAAKAGVEQRHQLDRLLLAAARCGAVTRLDEPRALVQPGDARRGLLAWTNGSVPRARRRSRCRPPRCRFGPVRRRECRAPDREGSRRRRPSRIHRRRPAWSCDAGCRHPTGDSTSYSAATTTRISLPSCPRCGSAPWLRRLCDFSIARGSGWHQCDDQPGQWHADEDRGDQDRCIGKSLAPAVACDGERQRNVDHDDRDDDQDQSRWRPGHHA